MVSLHELVLTLAFVLFAVSTYLSTSLAERLERAAFAILMLGWLLAGARY